ncbi:HipA domain-containing protein [Nocardia arizonensis]|uniref:HipA domain-containing protein n=1 Tax=Nocardia arizonensis TaxID=1141647 RepID=UPI0006D21269
MIYRGHDSAALQEFVRRLVFSILIVNGDAHLKNWSLIYYDKRIPTLSPAYDIMATEPYPFRDEPEDLGMKFGGGKRFDSVRVDQFARLAKRLRAPDDLEFVAVDTVRRTRAQWQEFIEELDEIPDVRDCVHNAITSRAAMMLDRT